ncbi:MAG: glycosyltransferase family 2 protein [Planctomycetota bacterium]|nr:glycosyltransferase family 2 protein [Planctomycetota bacterium]
MTVETGCPGPSGPVKSPLPPEEGGTRAISVVVPTYQEGTSLPGLIERLEGQRAVGWDIDLIIVDDNSKDGTVEFIESLQANWIRLIVRTDERGLGTAVIHGLEESRHDILIVMDADLSHPPEAIPAFVQALESGADFVVGSRYVPGGSTEDGWGYLRWVNSKVATFMARPFTRVKDPMSGFLGIRRETLQNAEDLDPVGYKIGLELIVKCRCRNVAEVPIHFSTRRHGESKLTLKVQRDYLRHILRLARWKYPERASFVPFAVVGAMGVGVYAGLLAILVPWFAGSIGKEWVIVIAILLTMCFNFVLDRKLAFWWAPRKQVLGQFLGFLAICSIPVIINFWVTSHFAVKDDMATPLAGVIGASVGSILGVVFNWTISRLLIFSRRRRGS